MDRKKIVVFGATGTSGSAVTRALVGAGWGVRAVTRSASSEKAKAIEKYGADLVEADLDDRPSVRRAIRGVETVYMTGPSLTNRWDIGQAVQGINVADAAVEEGVAHYIYQSALVSTGRGCLSIGSKRAIEERIAELKLPSTITRPGLFMDNLLTHFPPQKTDGAITVAMPLPLDSRQKVVCAEDIGRAAAAVAAAPERYIGTEIDLVADVLSLSEMAGIIGEEFNMQGRPCSLPIAALEAQWPQGIDLFRWLSDQQSEGEIGALRTLIGAPLSFREWVKRHLAPVCR